MLGGICGGAGILQNGDGVVAIVTIPRCRLNGPAGAHSAQIEVVDVVGPQRRLQRRAIEGADPGLGQHQIAGLHIQIRVKIGAWVGKRQRPQLVSATKHGRPLGLQLIAAVKAHLDQHYQPAVGAGMGQRLIGMRNSILFQHMGCRGGNAPVGMGNIVDKIDHQQCLVHHLCSFAHSARAIWFLPVKPAPVHSAAPFPLRGQLYPPD